MGMENLWNDAERERPKYWEKRTVAVPPVEEGRGRCRDFAV
jgi:hypothetical protein